MSALLSLTNAVVIGTNAVTTTLFDQIVDFAKKFDLPEQRATVEDIREVVAMSPGEFMVRFRDGNQYNYDNGFVGYFVSSHSYYQLQDPEQIPQYYGKLNLNKEQAVAFARQKIRDYGYSEEEFYADLEPDILGPSYDGANMIPYYQISWPTPNFDVPCIKLEINGEAKRVESVVILNDDLWRDENGNKLPDDHTTIPRVPEDESCRIMQATLPQIETFSRRLGLPVLGPITTNLVKKVRFYHYDEPVVEGRIFLKDGYSFLVRDGAVYGFARSDEFFDATKHIKVKHYLGFARISDAEAIGMVRKMAKRLGVSNRAVGGEPDIITRPYGQAKELVPRISVIWRPKDRTRPFIMAEVDKASGTISAFMFMNFYPGHATGQ